jgi:hypothetical protein
MREQKKRSPENGGAGGEMVVEMSGGSAKFWFGLAGFIEARYTKTFVGVLIVPGEIETVFDERGAGKGVVANAVAAHPGIEKEQREKKEKKKQTLRCARASRGRCAKGWLIHERNTCRKPCLFPAASIAGQLHDMELISREQERDLVAARTLGGIVPHDVTWKLDIRGSKRGCSDGECLGDLRKNALAFGGPDSVRRLIAKTSH